MDTKNKLCLRTFKQPVIVRFSFFIITPPRSSFFLLSCLSLMCNYIFVVHLKLFVGKNGRRLRDITGNVCALKQGRNAGNIKTGFPVVSHFVVCSLELEKFLRE